jgi:signal transduction histidine kinase
MCFNNSVLEVVSLVQHAFSLDKVAIVTDMDDRMPIIYGDPDKLKQVWINLLNNARDAVGQGGTVLVQTKLDTPAQKVTLWIADNGPGIPAEDLTRIFDPFFTTKPVGEGTGLGLSVSFGIVEDHGGSIVAVSPVPQHFRELLQEGDDPRGPGTVFQVELPLDHASETEARNKSREE